MRKFSSYGPVSTTTDYYVPRTELIDKTCRQLLGEEPDEGGRYITVWAPRQTGKTWLLIEVMQRLRERDEFDVVILSMQSAANATSVKSILNIVVDSLRYHMSYPALPEMQTWEELRTFFTSEHFKRPLILILDEFDAMQPEEINAFANEFRFIHTERKNEPNKRTLDKRFMLHGLALIGVRSVLGIENVSGSPFNVQRSVHVPNLTKDEVASMFRWYEEESGQRVEPDVIDRLFYETRGQPGLVSWFGELLTETYNRNELTITADDFKRVFSAGLNLLPNNNILNIISKAKQEPYIETIYELYRTDEKMVFTYDDPHLNFLYMNGVVDQSEDEQYNYHVRFSSPFVQKRLFNYFSRHFFGSFGRLYDPFSDMSATITDSSLSVHHLMRRYEAYLQQNRDQVLKNAPRRATDNRVVEAIFHFNLYRWLHQFITEFGGQVTPEFPTGNGKIDLIIDYVDQRYGVELKSFTNRKKYAEALGQAARYGKQLKLSEIWLVFFVEMVDDENRKTFEVTYHDSTTKVTVYPILVVTG